MYHEQSFVLKQSMAEKFVRHQSEDFRSVYFIMCV